MLFGLIPSRMERAAEHDAALLRARYGADAERFCESALTGQERPSAARAIRAIRRALKRSPTAQVRAPG
jgi:hypothetical protein